MEQHPDSPAAPADPGAAPSALFPAFEPVPVRYRRDGWTPARQRAFIAALAERRCVLEACRRVGKSPEAAYKLYRRPDAAGFRTAWNAALAVRSSGPAAAPDPLLASPKPSAPPASSASARRWQPSLSPGSSTSGAPLPPRGAGTAYSLDAFVRAARRSRIAAPAKGRASA